ncbi:hypothetical protein [Rhodopseudomonas sp. RCAM05734]|uniref:hypothetical protein n=1 Tax=Rhodopseudomonas sp. RCAM05734 TaxID=3457549 RepID=UPI004044E282
MKTPIDVELALRWAWRDELSKRQTSAAEAVWDRIDDFGRHGGVDVDGGGGVQRYDFGVPDPDAEILERAIAELEPVVIDWGESLGLIAGDLAGLLSVNDFRRQHQPQPKAGWGKAGDRALRGWFGPGGERPQRDRPRDVMMVGTFNPKVLVTVHAMGASRPDWREDDPMPGRVLSTNGKDAMVEGKCEGRNRYSAGSYCPLEWDPSPLSIIQARADYVVWLEALHDLAASVELTKFTLLPPRAAVAPWFGDKDAGGRVIHVPPVGPMVRLPLVPARGKMLHPFRRTKDAKTASAREALR